MRVCPVRNVFRPTKEGIPVRYRTDSVPGVELLGYGMAELYGEFDYTGLFFRKPDALAGTSFGRAKMPRLSSNILGRADGEILYPVRHGSTEVLSRSKRCLLVPTLRLREDMSVIAQSSVTAQRHAYFVRAGFLVG